MIEYKKKAIIKKKKLVLRTIAMPLDKNINGKIFGGWIMSQMDLGGGVLAKQLSKGRVSTVHVKNINFLIPISVGDLVSCYAQCIKIGETSMEIKIDIWIKKILDNIILEKKLAAFSNFVYVAIDKNGKPRKINI